MMSSNVWFFLPPSQNIWLTETETKKPENIEKVLLELLNLLIKISHQNKLLEFNNFPGIIKNSGLHTYFSK